MDYTILLVGAAGQGIETIENLTSKALKEANFDVFSDKEYMSRVRGGINSTTIRVSSCGKRGYLRNSDFLFAFTEKSIEHASDRISQDTLIFGSKRILGKIPNKNHIEHIEVDFIEIANKIGKTVYANTVAFGFIAGLFSIDLKIVDSIIKSHFAKDLVQDNIMAARDGFNTFKEISNKRNLKFELSQSTHQYQNKVLLSGSQAVAFGALAANAKFLSFYPMSPSTEVAVFLAHQMDKFDIVVEQFEDEIAAANAAIGAWFGGTRAFVTTSGGGYALMEEAISLSGMSETPIVVHLAQRPAPATGLPTRTSQSDLNLVLYSSHGDFPRAIFTPRNLEDAYFVTQKAFDVADKYQIPSYILTDQYFMSMMYTLEKSSLKNIEIKKYIVEMSQGYKRYELTEDGISPRGIPGYGDGIIVANGNEHDEYGDITEDEELTKLMIKKRNKKLKSLSLESLEPEFIGHNNFKYLIVCFGSLYENVKEACETLGRDDLALLSYSQVYPLNIKGLDYLKKAQKLIFIEQNYTGQFAQLVFREYGIKADKLINKYTGRQFFVEEIIEQLKTYIGGN